MTRPQPVPFPITTSEGLRLEGVLHKAEGKGPWPGVVVCHPHPLYGGDMDHPLVVAVAQALHTRGFCVVRFNFRGTGASEGVHSHGVKEVEDAAEALLALGMVPGVDNGRLGIVGYSFGAGIALEVASQPGMVQAVGAVAPPASALNHPAAAHTPVPKLFICGDQDHIVPAEQFQFLVRRWAEPKEVHLLEGVDHFFRGAERQVALLVADFFARWLGHGRLG
ncbi:MAG: alpha/beta fold hydrolase [Dehalococcoidia bacterium]|nr:alpha/beta fold hydrolase [Dehalococcoidia bacterium]MDW8120229.1 alpha/beta fold hydrolase [Chloroflexota bacterium]